MAKTPTKSAKATQKAPAKSSKPKTTSTNLIEKAGTEALKKLKSLGIGQELQNDLEWCLGSYKADGNPIGLYDVVERTIPVLKAELSKKTKGVTSKLVTDLEKSLQNR